MGNKTLIRYLRYQLVLTFFQNAKSDFAVCPIRPNKPAIISLEVFCERASFVGFGSNADNGLFFSFWLIRMYPRFVYCNIVYGF